MHIDNFKSNINIKPLKFDLKEVPHLTIETNKTCNIECRSCYSLDRNHVKSLSDVIKEIDLAADKRNLETITLLGGEPTLHPNILEIINYIKSIKLKCQLLTNGIVLINDKNDRFLDKLANSKIDRILLHVDIGQKHVHKAIDKIRDILFSKFEGKRIHFALSITIFKENKGYISRLVKKYSRYKYFDGILAILYRDPMNEQSDQIEILDEYESIYNQLAIEPTNYIPFNLDDNDVSWLIYFYFINATNGKTYGISPLQDRIFRKLYRIINGHHLFAIILNPTLIPTLSILLCIIGLIRHPSQSKNIFQLLSRSNFLRSIRMHFVVIQTPPEFNYKQNTYQYCYHCPDATIRNGVLTPVCVADRINPLPNFSEIKKTDLDLYKTAYEHLGEI
jgi:organic radical activating enzyme